MMKCDVFYFWLVVNAQTSVCTQDRREGSLLQGLVTSGCHPTRLVQIIIIFLL